MNEIQGSVQETLKHQEETSWHLAGIGFFVKNPKR